MDNSRIAWSTPTAALVATAIGGFALGIGALAVPTDPPGRLLVGLAAVGLLVITGLGAARRPRLAVLPGPSLRVGRLRADEVYSSSDIHQLRVVRYPRLGRRVPMLEIDVHSGPDGVDRLLIFGRWDLGANPEDVFDALTVQGLVPSDR